ncbi:SCP-2 sterol transfer family protein [Mycolicibacterium parafortuitum]|uniref:SCP2 domain-containing protein n=1 Tax=Mycolicibacterium parafortuitum TaxID=39692 RepID=A0A375YKV9_MYCPF|nr:SCP-2 sterol transfer family protein [Mycolicibacterium parafortuitum]ORB28336.1 SCP-2 sterol transfer family protein [Mycolicibacterium parafortuitum]SRX81751.1 hypothetical protein MPP7335_03507 [Mycolicibacterium parafortuitum]
MAESVSELLRRSVRQLETEVPDSYRHTLDALGPLAVALSVDGERFSLSGGDRLVVTDGEPADAAVSITTSRATMLDVLDAHVALTDAVEAGAVEVRGSLEHVLRAHDTLRAYVHAATRAPSHHGLLDALRAS